MSLLEDLMVEEDLLGDPSQLESIEDDFEEINEDVGEAEEQNDENKTDAKKVEPKKRIIKNPQPKLNADRLRGPRGIATLELFFKDIKFKGKGHEKEDLNNVMRKMEHWCHRLYPKFKFDDCLSKIETLGSKKVVQTYVNKIRQGMIDPNEDDVIRQQEDEVMEEVLPTEDEFDQLLDEQIAQSSQRIQPKMDITDEMKERILHNKERARQKLLARRFAQEQQLMEYENIDLSISQPSRNEIESNLKSLDVEQPIRDTPPLNDVSQEMFVDSVNPIPGTSKHITNSNTSISEEQRERMERQRQLAIQKRLERLKKLEEEKLQQEISELEQRTENLDESTMEVNNLDLTM